MANANILSANRLTCFAIALALTSCVVVPGTVQRRTEEMRSSVQKLCAQARVDIKSPISGKGFLVDRSFIGTGLKRPVYFNDYLHWMLDRQLSFLEVTFERLNSHMDWMEWERDAEGGPFVRLSLKLAGDPSCNAYVKWTSKYPAQKLPWLRRSGVSADLCIGIERVDTPESRFQVQTSASLIDRLQYPQVDNVIERYDFVVRDRLTGLLAAEATFPINTGWEHRDVMCGKQPLFDEFANALVPVPDPRYVRPREVLVQRSSFVDRGAASDRLLETFRWNGSVERDNLSNIVSADGNAWVEPIYDRGSLRGYSLALVVGEKLFKAPILPDTPMGWLTGIGESVDSVATIAKDTAQAHTGKLLVVNRQGEPQAAYSVSADQMERLKGKP